MCVGAQAEEGTWQHTDALVGISLGLAGDSVPVRRGAWLGGAGGTHDPNSQMKQMMTQTRDTGDIMGSTFQTSLGYHSEACCTIKSHCKNGQGLAGIVDSRRESWSVLRD